MSITSAIVLFCVIWAIVFYMVNPLWQTSQSEDGEVVPSDPKNSWEGKKYVDFEGVDPRFTTVSDAAQLLGVTLRQVEKLIAQGKLEAEKRSRTIGADGPGGEWAVKLDSLYQMLTDRLGMATG